MAFQNLTTRSTTARSWSPAADAFACTTRKSISAYLSPAKPSALKKSTTASGWLVLWITISAISIWRKKPCSPCRTPSGQKCNLCLRNVLLPMSPERTLKGCASQVGIALRRGGSCASQIVKTESRDVNDTCHTVLLLRTRFVPAAAQAHSSHWSVSHRKHSAVQNPAEASLGIGARCHTPFEH